mmetsp:Transcript_1613/g.3617  ORF Transcript_1613/g.3617 Transcript_1613/m.3617 type:complete len:211 (+) Transcript_1613:607-1239(+)
MRALFSDSPPMSSSLCGGNSTASSSKRSACCTAPGGSANRPDFAVVVAAILVRCISAWCSRSHLPMPLLNSFSVMAPSDAMERRPAEPGVPGPASSCANSKATSPRDGGFTVMPSMCVASSSLGVIAHIISMNSSMSIMPLLSLSTSLNRPSSAASFGKPSSSTRSHARWLSELVTEPLPLVVLRAEYPNVRLCKSAEARCTARWCMNAL